MAETENDILERALSRRTASQGRQDLRDLDTALNERSARLAQASAEKQARFEQYQGSLAGRLGLEQNGADSTAANLYASALSGSARVAGDLMAMPLDAYSVSQERGITDEQRDAYARLQQDRQREQELAQLREQKEGGIAYGDPQLERLKELEAYQPQASEADRALLNARAEQVRSANLNAPEVYSEGAKTSDTVLQRLDRAEKARGAAQWIDDKTDWSSLVAQGSREELSADIASGSEEGLDRFRRAVNSFKGGEYREALSEGLPAVADLALNAGDALMNNPKAVAEYVAENASQLALGGLSKGLMTASNIGYGLDNYREGILKYQEDNDGRQPPEEEREKRLLSALGAAFADQIGDAALLGKVLPNKAARTGRESFKRSLLKAPARTAGKTASGTATETVTEGVQTGLEARAKGERASAEEIYEGAAIGGAVGGTISGAGASVQEAGRVATAARPQVEQAMKQAEAEAARDDAFEAAVETGDVTAYTDREKPTYAPDRAVQVLAQRNQREDLSDEARQANLEEASRQIAALEEEVGVRDSEYQVLTPEGQSQLRDVIQQSETRLADLEAGSEEATALEETLNIQRDYLTASEKATKAQRRQAKEAYDTARDRLDRSLELRDRMGKDRAPDTEGFESTVSQADSAPETEGSSQAASDVITLAMESPDLLTPERAQALADNEGNAFTPEQRTYLRQLSAVRIQENRVKGAEGVRNDIVDGDRKGDFIGVNQYRSRVRNQLSLGNREGAETEVAGLRRFARQHAEKYAAAQAALTDVAGTGGQINLTYSRRNGWQRSNEPLSRAERENNGGLEITEARSKNLVAKMGEEVKLLEAAVAELESGIEARLAPSSVDATTQQGSNEGSSEASVPVMITQDMRRQLSERGYDAAAVRKMTPQDAWDALNQPEAGDGTQDIDEDTADATATTTADAAADTTADVATEPAAETAGTAEPARPTETTESGIEADPTTGEVIAETAEAETTPVTERAPLEDGTLSKLAQGVKDAAAQTVVNAQNFWNTNLVSRYFSQSGGGQSKTSRKPLAVAKNFIGALQQDPSVAQEFLTEEMTESQEALVGYLAGLIPAWNETVESLMPKPGNERFAFEDLSQFLRNEDGSLDENLKSAISLAAMGWVAESGVAGAYNDDSAINALLGREADDYVTTAMRQELGMAGSRERVAINRMGGQVLQSLGLSPERDVPANVREQLIGSLGGRAMALLLEEGVVEKKVMSQQELDALTGTESDPKDRTTHAFIRAARNEGSQGRQQVEEISRFVNGSGGLLANLFGAESGPKAPSFKKVPFTQKQAKNSNRGIPAPLAKILEGEGKKAHYVREEMVTLWRALDENTKQAMAGGIDPETTRIHNAKVKSVQGKNDALLREIQRFDAFLGSLEEQPSKLATPFYFARNVWKMQRVGLDATLVNPQTSKVQRHLIKMGGWDTEVNLNDYSDGPNSVNTFMLAVGEAFGVKTDAMPAAEALREIDEKLEDPAIKAGVVAIMRSLNNESFDQQAVIDAVAAGGEGFHSLDGLMGLAQMRLADDAQQTSFTTALTREVDGKTNGPMLSLGQLAAAANPGELLKSWVMGGFFSKDSGHTQVNEWANQKGNQDLYQRTAVSIYGFTQQMIAANPAMAEGLDHVYAFTGPLYDAAKEKVLGRNMVKTPVTALVFGSSQNSVVDSMAGNFVDAVYDKFEAIANSMASKGTQDAEAAALMQRINAMVGRKVMNPATGIDGAMAHEFKKGEQTALKNHFSNTLGVAVKDAMEQDFGTFIERRQVLNQSANAAYRLYWAAYEHERQKLLDRLVKDGTIPTRKSGGALLDLTPEQDAEIRTKLKALEPVIHSAFSKVEGNLDNGIFLAKTRRTMSDEEAYAQNVKLAKKVGPEGLKVQSLAPKGNRLEFSDPGVAAVIMAIHSSDSYIAANTYGAHTGLNVHDAIMASLADTPDVARDLNRHTLEVLTDYSVPSEIADALERTVTGFEAYVAEEGLSPALLEGLAVLTDSKLDTAPAVQKQQKGKGELAKAMKLVRKVRSTAQEADRIKLGALDQLQAVDQYSLAGGNYVLTEEAHSRIQAKMVEGRNSQPGLDETLERLRKASNVTPQQVRPDPAPEAKAEAPQRGQTVWGTLGQPSAGNDPALVAALASGKVRTAGQLNGFLRQHLKQMPAGRTRDFYQELLGAVSRQVPKDLPIHYVTAQTPAEQRPSGFSATSRGAFSVDGQGNAGIFLKSTDYAEASVTPELALHELMHAATAQKIQAERAAIKANPDHDNEVTRILKELETLRGHAEALVNTDEALQREFGAAVTNVDELIAWGMTNPKFQQRVLNQVRMESRMAESGLITGMKELIRSLVGILFRGSDKSSREKRENGAAILIANVSGLLNETETEADPETVTLSQEGPKAKNFTTREVFDALPGGQDAKAKAHLRELLDGIVEKLHGPYGAFHEQARANEAMTPEDVFIKALRSGQAPFVSETLAAGFQVDEQQAFVLEQVEATVAAGLGSDFVAYRELAGLYREAREQLKGQLPQDQYDFLFTIKADDRALHLSRFAAVALTYPPVRDQLSFATAKTRQDLTDMPLGQKIVEVFRRLLNALNGKLTKTYQGQPADAKLTTLIDQLVDIEAKRRGIQAQQQQDRLGDIEDVINDAGRKAIGQIEKLGRSKIFRQRSSGYLRAAGSLTSTLAGERGEQLLDHIQQVRDRSMQSRQGVVSSLITEMRGSGVKAVAKAYRLLREQAKVNEHARLHIMDTTKKNVLESFENGSKLDQKTKASLTQVLLRTDMAALDGPFDADQLVDLVTREQSRRDAIAQAEQALSRVTGDNLALYREQARALGYHMVTGKATISEMRLNAHNIAFMPEGISEADGQAAMEALDPLISLYALEYTDEGDRARAGEVMKTERNRGKESGVAMTLKLYKGLQQDAKERLFQDNLVHMQKGYTSQIYNPYVSVTVAAESEAGRMKQMGYQHVGSVPKDPADPNGERKALYAIRDGGMQRHLTGIVSYRGEGTRGSTLHSGLTSVSADGIAFKPYNAQQNLALRQAQGPHTPDANFDPRQVAETRLVPVLNQYGEAVNYRYTMQDATKDKVLQRHNGLEDVLGAMAGSNMDKETSKEQNRLAIEALHEQYKAEYAERPESYVRVGPNAQDPRLREAYNMLPADAKQTVRDLWGGDEMLVRVDLVDINFGYRKASMANLFAKDMDERNAMEKIVTMLPEAFFGKKTALRVKQFEDIWQGLVTEVKDIVVIKNLFTLLGNIGANMTLLMWRGVSPMSLVRDHREALDGILTYRKDYAELEKLKQLRNIGYVTGGTQEIDQRIAELEDAIEKNPTRELVEAGLLPTIVEDVDQHEDPFSYKSQLATKVDEWTGWMPKGLKTAGKTLYMAHDTPLYKVMSQGTQLSDFVARYTLVKHLTTRPKNALSMEEALDQASDAFVNYDVPTHRGIQYMNDMGIIWFTKYYFRIQRTILQLYREQPARAMALIAMNTMMPGMPSLMDAQLTERMDSNPLSVGALRYPETVDEIATLKAALSPFN